MVDIFSLTLPHGLLLIAVWRLLQRGDLDREEAPAPTATAAQDNPRA